ncbi:hypothetical protein UlMin_011117 [Ulmus minor]
MAENRGRGSIGFSSIYRPPVPLDIYSCPRESPSEKDEVHMTDGDSYNYIGQVIPAEALKTILKRPKLASEVKAKDVDSGVVFVSERGDLETLHIALRIKKDVKVFSLDEVYEELKGVRMEDSGCVAGKYLIYVSTKEPAKERRQPWTAVYKTDLNTGKTERLTPKEEADLNPSVSPSGNKIAVVSFQRKGGWDGEIEDLQTDIFLMNVEKPLRRKLVVKNGGWPTWGSDNVLFFHRKVGKFWVVFRADITNGQTSRVTPKEFHAMTPVAINTTSVAVATIREKSRSSATGRKEEQYRHIEIFDSTTTGRWKEQKITQKIKPLADHFNPFVIDGGKRIGYHRCKSGDNIPTQLFGKLKSPLPDVELFRVSGVFATFSKDGSKIAFVDNEFATLWVADSKGPPRIVYKAESRDKIFSPVWNQDPKKDTLYVCKGPSFSSRESVDICAIPKVSRCRAPQKCDFIQLTNGFFNNSFPSTNPDGTKLVFRSTRSGYKNLYIMEDAKIGEYSGGKITRLTHGAWTDTHCQWSPREDWIVFSSTRDKPEGAPEKDNGLDPGYFAVFLVNVNKRDVVIRVLRSGSDVAGHVNHPFFSPDGRSIVVTADLAGVSVDPISLPLFEHSVRPYGDIFTVDIDLNDINKNKDVKKFTRITHSRYENSPSTWTMFSTQYQNYAAWNQQVYTPASCPYNPDGGESFNITGHLCIPKRCC